MCVYLISYLSISELTDHVVCEQTNTIFRWMTKQTTFFESSLSSSILLQCAQQISRFGHPKLDQEARQVVSQQASLMYCSKISKMEQDVFCICDTIVYSEELLSMNHFTEKGDKRYRNA